MIAAIKFKVLKAVKVRIEPNTEQQSHLAQAFINFFEGPAQYPTFKKRQGRQSMQYAQPVKILSDRKMKFPGHLGVVKAKIHRDLVGNLKTVTVSK